jgi:hypothetical protein
VGSPGQRAHTESMGPRGPKPKAQMITGPGPLELVLGRQEKRQALPTCASKNAFACMSHKWP